ncbi:MAG: hypothetical protein LBG47_09205, partial [Prevotellaceae bacterium]|nr:hypothetical protein [Prevotellaceae bacterium]
LPVERRSVWGFLWISLVFLVMFFLSGMYSARSKPAICFFSAQMTQIFMICTDFSPFFSCVNHKNLRHLRAIFTQNYAERSIGIRN